MQPEFQEPVRDAQAVFRAILRAFAYPAGPVPCPVLPASPHAALSPALAAVCMTLMDQDTPLWLSPSQTGRCGGLAQVSPQRARHGQTGGGRLRPVSFA